MNTVESFWKTSPTAGDPRHRERANRSHPGHHSHSLERTHDPVPAYRVHRTKGLGYVRLNKRMVYLGKANTPESFERYRRALAEWLASGRVPVRGKWDAPPTFTINVLVKAYLTWARQYYLDADGRPSPGLQPVEASTKAIEALYGPTPAAEFGPVALKAVRNEMIHAGLCRHVINQRVSCIKRMFRWAVGEELLPAPVMQALFAVEALRVGRSAARETEPVRPVPDEHVEAVLPFLPPTLRAMVRLQRLTGMRSGELCVLRTADIETRGAVWIYRPRSHKTTYRGHERAVRIGPKGQAVLQPFLRAGAPQAFMFSPRCALEERYLGDQQLHGATTEGDIATSGVRSGLCERYKPRAYNRALHYAMKRAMGAGALRREECWHPHQLRHGHATEIRQLKGLEAARVLLGHRTLSQTLEYAEADAGVASSVALELG